MAKGRVTIPIGRPSLTSLSCKHHLIHFGAPIAFLECEIERLKHFTPLGRTATSHQPTLLCKAPEALMTNLQLTNISTHSHMYENMNWVWHSPSFCAAMFLNSLWTKTQRDSCSYPANRQNATSIYIHLLASKVNAFWEAAGTCSPFHAGEMAS